ncbi:MAG: tRNA (guanosine(46)-N7)-methyltransferase TrmB [Cyanobacteria bacterium P01_F01_bin.150]
MESVRVRQHVNPLGIKYRDPVNLPDWSKLFVDMNQPFHLDIGSARGQFLLGMAQDYPDWNFLGAEIREPLVNFANGLRDELSLTNLFFIFCNANSSIEKLLSSLPQNALQRVTIQFPDPWFKRRHRKRRVVQPELVEAIAQHLAPGGVLFLQSDIESVAVDMRDRFLEHKSFEPQWDQAKNWYSTPIFPIATEREIMTKQKGQSIYRCLFIRRA